MPADPLAATRKWRERDRRRRGVVAVTVEVHKTRVGELKALAAQMQEAKMTTYTIAMVDDLLIATAPDGDTKMMERRLDAMDGELVHGWREQVRYHSGLTLVPLCDDIPDGAEVVYDGVDLGWLEDAAGRMEYRAAVRLP